MATTWSDLAGRHVGVWGYGVEGAASVSTLADSASVLVVDDRAASLVDLPELAAVTVSGDPSALLGCDVVIKSPGISRNHPLVSSLEQAGIGVLGGHGVWLNSANRRQVACVTGTKGKSTTASVVGYLFTVLELDGDIGGNIGAPPFAVDAPLSASWCLELSSFQVTDIELGPRVVALTSLGSDHVDWHGGHERYVADKLSLATKPGVEIVLANSADRGLRSHSKTLGNNVTWVEADSRAGLVAESLGLRGEHNVGNVALALSVVEALCKVRIEGARLETVLSEADTYVGLPCRLSTIATVAGVEFVDDSLSTNVLPVISALDVFADRPTAWIVGGADRGIDYGELVSRVRSSQNPLLVVAMGDPDNGHDIADRIADHGLRGNIEIVRVDGLAEAVSSGAAWCQNRGGGVVLLSPGAPTWSDSATVQRYPNYKAKSSDYAAIVANLAHPDTSHTIGV